MKKFLMLVVSALCVLTLVSPSTAGFWFGFQGGPNWTADSNVNFKVPPLKGSARGYSTDTGMTVGAIAGYDFDNRDKVPTWMQYFGGAIDFTYNPYNHPVQNFNGAIWPAALRRANFDIPQNDGSQWALSFLLKGRYPLMVSTEFPQGRLLPYLMVGPAIVWTNSMNNNPFGLSSQTSTNVGLVVEPGIDYMIVQNVAMGISFRYRHVWGPNFSVNSSPPFSASTNLDQFTVLARISYRF